MKKLSIVIFLAALLAGGIGFVGCSPEPETKPEQTDTTEDKVILNEFKIGFDTYKIETYDDFTYGYYSSADNKTYIFVEGVDATHGAADWELTFEGNMMGTFSSIDDKARFSCGTGTKGTVYREEFSADGGSVNVVVTEYGAENSGKIKGTFSGKVQKGLQSVTISNGKFEVPRRQDQ